MNALSRNMLSRSARPTSSTGMMMKEGQRRTTASENIYAGQFAAEVTAYSRSAKDTQAIKMFAILITNKPNQHDFSFRFLFILYFAFSFLDSSLWEF
jgi:hypothetical protein